MRVFSVFETISANQLATYDEFTPKVIETSCTAVEEVWLCVFGLIESHSMLLIYLVSLSILIISFY